MKSIIYGLLLCFCTIGYSYDVYKVHARLVAANGVKNLPLYVMDDIQGWCSMACTDGKAIYVDRELLSEVKNEDELAGIIGHEMAHLVYKGEMDADVLGLKYAKKAGWNYCKSAQYLKRMKGGDGVHPAGAIRYKNTGCP